MRFEARVSNGDVKILLFPETEDDWKIIDMTANKELQPVTRPTRDSDLNNAMIFPYCEKERKSTNGPVVTILPKSKHPKDAPEDMGSTTTKV